jgi:hypothetical protein
VFLSFSATKNGRVFCEKLAIFSLILVANLNQNTTYYSVLELRDLNNNILASL